MSTSPRHPRDYGGMFTLENQDDGSPIREQIVLGDRLLNHRKALSLCFGLSIPWSGKRNFAG